MDTSTFDIEAAVEAGHWWFVGRRRLLADVLARHRLSTNLRVLDIGTSTGTNLRLLRDLGFGNRTGLDPSADAIRWCAEKGLGTVIQGDVCALPFDDGAFDLVFATDVIEHVEDDARAMSEIARVLVPGGSVILTVPAFPSLWGLQDVVSHHKRRYRMVGFTRVIDAAGLRRIETYHFNYLLFAPIWLARQLIRLLRIPLKSENQVNNRWINRILTWVFGFDVRSARFVRPPFGVSILSVATKVGPT